MVIQVLVSKRHSEADWSKAMICLVNERSYEKKEDLEKWMVNQEFRKNYFVSSAATRGPGNTGVLEHFECTYVRSILLNQFCIAVTVTFFM